MVSEFIQPLDLKYIFVNVFAGSLEMFMGIAFLGMCILAGVLRMPDRIFILMIILSSVLLYTFFGAGLYTLVILIVGAIIFGAITKIVK